MKSLLLAAALLALPSLLPAQPTAHYPVGIEGIKGGSLPPPGVYLRDYNLFYFADRLNDNNGNEIKGADPEAFVYANVPRLVWITDKKFLGGFVGVDALLPLQYTSLEAGPFDKSTFGIGDVFAEATLSWHEKQFDVGIGYGVWMPTGDYAPDNPTLAGSGFWTHMFTAGVTWYPDQEKKWSLSALNRYEINQEQEDIDRTPGQAYTLEWGLGYAITKTIELGVVGYYQCQTTKDGGSDGSPFKDQVVAVGPEISMFCPKLGLFTSIRYNYELMSENRLQGQTVALTLTKRF